MFAIHVTRQISNLEIDADEWELYDLPGREEAALRLCKLVQEAFNTSSQRGEAIRKAIAALETESKFGATDEGRWAISRITKAFYGD